jgi:Domain of unknown function (DUF4307)
VTHPPAPIFPPGRYGRRREPTRASRWVPIALAAVAALAVLWLALRLYTQYGANPYRADPVRYGEVTDTHVTVTFDVRKPAAGTGTCRVRARDRSGAETGYAEVKVGTGARVTTTYTLTTKARAVLVEVLGCNGAPR